MHLNRISGLRSGVGGVIALLLAMAHGAAHSAPLSGKFFEPLKLSPDAFFGVALDVSADGAVVVGAENGAKRWGFRWTADIGLARLSNFVGDAKAVSADGKVIAGNNSGGAPAYRWDLGIGVRAVPYGPNGFPPDQLTAISADGRTFVGHGFADWIGNEIFTWTEGQSELQLVPKVPGMLGGFAGATSADASVIVGVQVVQRTPRISRAARWVNGVGALLDQVPGATSSEGLAVSADGAVVGGSVVIPAQGRMDGFVWTPSRGMQLVGTAAIGLNNSSVQDLSADGGIAVGTGDAGGLSHGFVWSASRGVRLADELFAKSGVDTAGYSIFAINAVSDDGRTFAGGALSPAGQLVPFIARIPEPSTLSICCMGLSALLAAHRQIARRTIE